MQRYSYKIAKVYNERKNQRSNEVRPRPLANENDRHAICIINYLPHGEKHLTD
jgi:hypothetical protein